MLFVRHSRRVDSDNSLQWHWEFGDQRCPGCGRVVGFRSSNDLHHFHLIGVCLQSPANAGRATMEAKFCMDLHVLPEFYHRHRLPGRIRGSRCYSRATLVLLRDHRAISFPLPGGSRTIEEVRGHMLHPKRKASAASIRNQVR